METVGRTDNVAGAVGRYVLYDEIASGGMATVHLGRLRGPVGFARTVAIKRLHPNCARDPEFRAMFLDEARLAARIRHPNVASTVDIVSHNDELFLVMEYIAGEALSRLIRPQRDVGRPAPPAIALAIVADVLHGLHEAHEARDESGSPLHIVHRDISPHNVMVGVDGASRVLDFGIAKAASRISTTRDGQLKGKVPYMAPEQLTQRAVDARTDVFAASIVLWEALTGERLFFDENVGGMMARVLNAPIARPSEKVAGIPEALDAIVMRGLSRDPEQRFPTAKAMASALEELGPARAQQVGAWVESLAGTALRERASRLAEIERDSAAPPPLSSPPSPNDVPTQILKEPPPVEPVIVASSSAEPPRRRSIALPLVGVLALLALLAGGALAMTRRPEPAAPVAHEPPPPVPVATPSASVVAPVAPEPIASPAKSAPAPAPTPRKKPPTVATKPACDPPYFIDAEGVKRFKPGCL